MVFALQDWWVMAFVAIVLGITSDMLDGYLARRWNVSSDFGRDVLEPNSDLVLTVASMGGLLLAGEVSWWWVPVIAIPNSLGQLAIWRSPEGTLLRRIANGFMPLSYVAFVVALGMIYSAKAMGGSAVWLLIPTLPIATWVVWEKRVRWVRWLRGYAH